LDENGGKKMESNGNSKSGLLTAGGILSIVAGILQINTGGGLIGCCLSGSFIEDFPLSITFLPGFWPILNQHILRFFSLGYVPTGWVITGAFFVILGIVAVVGGISAIRRKRFGLSLAGAICALLSGLMGILAVIFVVLGKREFEVED
jgi:hypothetical protein